MDAVRQEPIVIACDHAGVELKEILAADLRAAGFAVFDLGTNGPDSVDYPDFGNKLAEAIQRGDAKRGVLICGTGIGISIAANKVRGIRAALVQSADAAGQSRRHNDANVLCFGAKYVDLPTALACVEAFLAAEFEAGRHTRRVDKLESPCG